jgi:hypothetical protein
VKTVACFYLLRGSAYLVVIIDWRVCDA